MLLVHVAVPPGFTIKLVAATEDPPHAVILDTDEMDGVGLMIILNVWGVALHPEMLEFTVIVLVVVVPTFAAVNPVMLPLPLVEPRPVPVLLLAHEAVALGVIVNAGTDTAALPQAVTFAIELITGVGLIVTLNVRGVALQEPIDAFTVMVPVVTAPTEGAV